MDIAFPAVFEDADLERRFGALRRLYGDEGYERIRAARVYVNGAPFDRSLPFGVYKQSANGREFGIIGF